MENWVTLMSGLQTFTTHTCYRVTTLKAITRCYKCVCVGWWEADILIQTQVWLSHLHLSCPALHLNKFPSIFNRFLSQIRESSGQKQRYWNSFWPAASAQSCVSILELMMCIKQRSLLGMGIILMNSQQLIGCNRTKTNDTMLLKSKRCTLYAQL